MSRNIFYVWLLFLPFVTWNGIYEPPKVIYFLIGAFCLCIFWLFQTHLFISGLSRRDLYFLTWIFVLFVSSILGADWQAGVLGGSYRGQGVVFFFGFWVLLKTLEAFKSQKIYKRIIFIWTLVGVLAIFRDAVFGMFVNDRVVGLLAEPNASAGFLSLSTVIFYSSMWFFIPFILLGIFLTYSKAGIASFLLILIFIALRSIKKKAYLVFLLLLVIVFLFLFRESFVRATSPFENRKVYFEYGLSAFFTRPILGYGAESTEKIYREEFARHNIPLEGLIVDRSHNMFLDILLWSGALGLVFFLGWLHQYARDLSRAGEYRKLIALGSWIVFACFQPLGVSHFVLLGVILNL